MTEGFVETNGVALWYQRRGQAGGIPFVLIHGVEASSIWWPSQLVDSLAAAGHEVVVFDNRDIGLSTQIDFDESPYGIDEMAEDTIGLLDGLGIEQAHLVGVSMGGMISQVVAIAQPQRVASLTLLSTTPGFDASLSPSDDSVFAGLDYSAETRSRDAEASESTRSASRKQKRAGASWLESGLGLVLRCDVDPESLDRTIICLEGSRPRLDH